MMEIDPSAKDLIMKRKEFLILAFVIPLALPGIAAAAAVPTAAEFVKMAGAAGIFEIASSELVLANASRADVKSFAQRMITDHKAAAEELRRTAGGKYTVPEKVDAKHQKLLDKLKAAGGTDKAYVKMQLEAHKEAIALFGNYAKRGDDAALQAFATKTLPTLQMHLDMIEKISKAQN